MSKANQILIVDESGDAGLSEKDGASKYISFGVVFFETLDDAQKCDTRIQLLKDQMGISDEFKFKKLSMNKRIKFFDEVKKSDFYFFFVTIDKKVMKETAGIDDVSFYKYACSLGFVLAKPYLENAVVIIDGSGSKDFQNTFKQYIKTKMDGKISKFKIQDSKKNNLIQLADMVAGAVAKRTSDKEEKDLYYKLISHRCIDYKYYPTTLLEDLRNQAGKQKNP